MNGDLLLREETWSDASTFTECSRLVVHMNITILVENLDLNVECNVGYKVQVSAGSGLAPAPCDTASRCVTHVGVLWRKPHVTRDTWHTCYTSRYTLGNENTPAYTLHQTLQALTWNEANFTIYKI